jgi:hypothetical protein
MIMISFIMYILFLEFIVHLIAYLFKIYLKDVDL